MKNRKWTCGLLVSGLALAMAGALQAAPEDNNAPMGDNPPNQQGGPPRGGRPDRRDMTPEQRQQMMQQMREQNTRETLTNAGFADIAVQDSVVAFVNEQEKATETLRDKARGINRAMRDETVSHAQLATLLADFRALAATEKARRAAAATELDAKIGYTKNARLDAVLLMSGIIGDGGAMLGGGGGRAGMGGGGPGGPGGRRGGRGGRGGQNGPGGGPNGGQGGPPDNG